MFRRCILLLCITGSVLSEGYENFKIFDVTASNSKQAKLLFDLSLQDDYDFFVLPKLLNQISSVMIPPRRVKEFIQLLNENKLTYTLVNDNVGQSIEEEFLENERLRLRRPQIQSPKLGTDRYYSHDEINNYIDYLSEMFPDRVFAKTVGKTYENRTMKTITITIGDDGYKNKKIIFIDGGIHAREWISPAAVLYVIEQLTENFEENRELLENYNWVILPVVNADGYEYTRQSTIKRMWRKTRIPYPKCYGADANRNFDFHWMGKGASADACSETYAGPSAFSEPEARVLRDVLISIKDQCKMYMTIHSYGNYLLYPWSWTSDLPETWKDLDEVAMAGYNAILNATGTIYTVGSSTNALYEASGSSDDYAFGVTNIPISIVMELPRGGLMGFDPPPSSIDKLVKETWIGIRAMGVTVINKY